MKQLLKQYNKIVCKDDLVYFFGDVGYREAMAQTVYLEMEWSQDFNQR